ncbi:hypothetical protein P879_03157 [Paragonimus westermani]|uniref:GTPase-activating Rap/Ran-GAP domain-like protein 3 n=1 Tax=Paragonimus westermani TaxID=34504 RepID=A0A8T0DHK3_9TREM|nr:hypothetical protein P879_03157 [Paragonimus westermani]
MLDDISGSDAQGYVNNAGRFRSEIPLCDWNRKIREPRNSNESPVDENSQIALSSLSDGEFNVIPEKEQESVETCSITDGPLTDVSDLNVTGENASLVTSHAESTHPTEDYFLFDLYPYAPSGASSSSLKQCSPAVHLENPERETRWYFKYFLGKYHQLYCGYVTERDPFLLAVAKTDVQTYGISQYRSILWRKTGSQKLCISYNPTNSLTAKKVLNFFDLQRIEKGPKEVLNFQVQKEALTLEEQEGSVNFKFGVIYCREGQTSDEQMYNNEHGSPEFDQFINLLGDRIRLKSWDHFKGGLDTKTNTTGLESVYTVYEGHEIMFHVSTLLPFSTENRQQIERKRHVGNDIVNIIFVDGVDLDSQPSWMPSMMKTHFTRILLHEEKFTQNHKLIVVNIFAIVTYDKPTAAYRLNVFAEESVPIFGPSLPNPQQFTDPQQFREFLLVKLINGEKAAFHSPVFAQKRERTLEMLLHVICSANLNEAGGMLKLNTIIRGDAPTSCITSGQSKKNPWHAKRFRTQFQHEIFCGDSWGDNLVISTEVGTYLLKENKIPVQIIDRTIDVKQLEVEEHMELLVLRFDKARESRIAVLHLLNHDFGQILDRQQLKKHSLDKTKGCYRFALSKSTIQPLKIAAVVHKRILIYQWQMITGHSLSSWNQIMQLNTLDSLQLIREVPIFDPLQTLTFIEGIPGGRLCIGHRNQFDLIDERNREIIQLYRTESSRNQVVSAHELWEEEEPELLLCFSRTCQLQKIASLSSSCYTTGKSHPVSLNSPEVQGLLPATGQQAQTTEPLPVSTSVPATGLLTNSGFTATASSLTNVNSSPDVMQMSVTTASPLSSTNERLRSVSEFEFTWNFEPEQVVVSSPYIFAFTSTSIELRLITNGSLVHTMLVPDCRLIASKSGLYFISTSGKLDNQCETLGICSTRKVMNEVYTSRKSTLSNYSTESTLSQDDTEWPEKPANASSTPRSSNTNPGQTPNTMNTNSNHSPPPPTTSTAGGDSLPVKPHYIYRITFKSSTADESVVSKHIPNST